jgi:hypothetical protein
MRQAWYKFLLFLLLVAVLAATPALAANGKISGTVKSAEGEPVVGANVVLEGTTLGTAADAAGKYFILNVPPGTYRVRASGVGFTPKVVTNVRVNADQFVTLDISLASQAVGMAEVVIEAARPPVDKSQTSAKTTMTADELQSLPIRGTKDLIATSASTYKGFVRGGKQYETKTIIDGVDMTDNFYAASADQSLTPYMTYNGVVRYDQASKSAMIDPNVSSVEEASVLTGGIGSDYSSATAGVIAYSLREGRGSWAGRADFNMSTGGLKHDGPDVYNDQAIYFSTKNTLLASGVAANIEKANRFTWTPTKYSYGKKPEMKGELALGGALGDNAGIYLTGGYFDTHGRMPNEFTRRVNASAKLNYAPSSAIKFNVVGMLEDRGMLFGWKNRVYQEDFRFFLEGLPKWDGYNLMGSVKMTHILSKETFYELQASFVNDEQRRGYSDDNNDGIIQPSEDGDFLTFADTSQVNRYMAAASGTQFNKFFSPSPRNETGSEVTTPMSGATNWKIARPGLYYDDLVNRAVTLRGDITSQISSNHQLRAGVMTKFNDIKRTVRAAYIGGYFTAYRNYVQEDWNVKPKEYSVYAQDRMEYAGLIINMGLRLDGYDFAANDYANWFAPFADVKDVNGGDVRVPVRGTLKTIYIGGKPTQVVDPTSSTVNMRTYLSPRLGVSHPISDKAAMYFSFSQTHQPQPYSQMYANYNDFGNPSLPVVARMNQDPIKSTSYELGVQWAFYQDVSLDINAYYKDIQNYSKLGFVVLPNAPYRQYNVVTNWGYADARGIELTLRRNVTPVTDWLSFGGRLSYTYSYIKASSYVGGGQTTFATSAGDSGKFAGQVPFDNFNFYNTIERNVTGGNSTLTGGYDRPHRIMYNLFFRGPFEISLTSIGTFQSGFYYVQTLGDPRARELGTAPWIKRIDFRLEKAFTLEKIGRVAFYVDLLNAFDWESIMSYYTTGTGLGQIDWERDGNPTGGPTVNRPITQDGTMIYDIPRAIYVGVNVSF